MAQKIIKLTKLMKPGIVYTGKFLKQRGYSPQLLYKYKKAGLIDSSSKGVYILSGSKPTMLSIVYTLQKVMELKLHIQSISALRLKGFVEQIYHNMENNSIELSSLIRYSKPEWLKRMEIQYKFTIIIKQSGLFNDSNYSIKESKIGEFNLIISEIERALFEMLNDISTINDFLNARKIFEIIPGFRTVITQQLMESCQSIKAKRLFLFFSEEYKKDYFNKLKMNRIPLGSGVRNIAKNSRKTKYIKKYNILIPLDYDE